MQLTKDMTTGNPLKTIMLFTIPIFLGNLLLQTYNLVDSIVVGQFVGVDAFGATSASSTILNLCVALLVGVGSGSSIIISQYFGRGNYDSLKRSFSTAIIALTIATAIISALGIIFARQLMIIIKVDPDIIDDAQRYLQIVFIGLVPMMWFNMYSAFLRGVGNSKMPLVFLGVSTVLNIILDILLVAVFNMGVDGVAIATSIANLVSAILTIIYTNRNIEFFALKKRCDFVLDMHLFKKIMTAGFPVIFQSLLVNISLVLLQGIFNSYGKDYTAAYGLSSRLDMIITLPLNSISTALATYVAQNKGADKIKRITQGVWQATGVMIVITLIFGILMMIFVDQALGIFISQDGIETSATAIKVTKEFIYFLGPFYCIMGVMFQLSSALAGASDIKAPIIIMTTSMIIRTIIAFAFQPIWTYYAAIWAFPISWIIGAIFATIRFTKGGWKTKTFMEN